MAPKDLLRSRPHGVPTILILILGSLIFRWATSKDLSEYDPFMPILQGEIVARVSGLRDAYGMANNHLDSSLDLEYWRERMRSTITIDSDLESDSGDSIDTEFQQALRESRDDYFTQSKHFIHIPIGPTPQQLRILPQHSLWNRPYFRDPRRGLNHFDYIDNTWVLRHPALPLVNPADFDFAAEYLESGGFGIRLPLDPGNSSSEDHSTVLTQCYAAWSVADRLDMHDLMEHVVDKLESITPDRDEMMVFACRIFGKKRDGDLPGHYRIKEFLAKFIAENWWGYVREGGEWFVERLERLPELERDVCEKRLEVLNERLDREDEKEEEEEEEEEEEDGGDGMEVD
ncbi:hypothetical protein COCMIDRAFT_37251 [Bipolaris oryzae ATCC 44560]|uniref:Uncharacterized protein n=1 Tax=Bipolaris oryzae ATCC 44560 TaxID=930090 RepID=W6ZN62_COCMI|nr:uncharacterized protein COCMIDRAFT_37251 [Bipolaris oryzae ATCC 44560]EUC45021.1 hypothetical protein COCMIDRAFT_37251 [Bipolaris oryzae ATCC 44560]